VVVVVDVDLDDDRDVDLAVDRVTSPSTPVRA
jgi:hypothetical protein